jgi:tRNA A37 methylthiotransferase MiaB
MTHGTEKALLLDSQTNGKQSSGTLGANRQVSVFSCRDHPPLQSDHTKRQAVRTRYKVEYVPAITAALRAIVPTVSLSTDLTLWFPGATDDGFRRMLHASLFG